MLMLLRFTTNFDSTIHPSKVPHQLTLEKSIFLHDLVWLFSFKLFKMLFLDVVGTFKLHH